MSSDFTRLWPSTLKTQISHSKSHEPLVKLIGEKKAVIGIFEVFSRTPLPKGASAVMSRVPVVGLAEIDQRLDGTPGQSASLSGYSVVVVTKAIELLSADERNAVQVRKVIHEAMHEVLKFDNLVHDIYSAARSLARINLSLKLSSQKSINRQQMIELSFREDLGFESLSERPQDWKSSHWWTGE